MPIKTALLCAVSTLIAFPVIAQDNALENSQDELIVQGSRLDQTQSEIGSSVSIITADEIETFGFDFAADAIAQAPGVTVNANGPFGGTASVRIRGASSEQTLVLIDGVAVNDTTSPGGGFDFARLDTENIERIEILKGPQSTLWGTDAIGGVVSITTKRPEFGLQASAFGEYGSFNTVRSGASLAGASDIVDLRLAVTGISSDGISKADAGNGNTEEDGYEALTIAAKGGVNISSDARLSADLLWTDAETEFDSFSFGSEGSVADGDEVSETKEVSANVSLTGLLFDGRLENLLLVGYSDIVRDNFTNGAPSFNSEGERTLLRYQGTLRINDANTLAFGAEREESVSGDGGTSLDGLFALYELKPIEALTLTGGLRFDDHETFGSETTARVAAAFNPIETLTLRGSWGEGFKAPTIFQTTYFCCGATEPNSDLQAERSEAFDVGIDWRSPDGRLEAGLTYFDQDTDNQINFAFAIGGYENIDRVRSKGVEAYGAYQMTDWLRASATYAYIDAKDGDGDPLIIVPEHSGDVTLSVDPDGPFSGAVLFRYNGEETNSDGSTLDSWTRIDVTGRFAVTDTAELFGRVENLLDEEYQQVLGYGTPGLSGSVGVRLRY